MSFQYVWLLYNDIALLLLYLFYLNLFVINYIYSFFYT